MSQPPEPRALDRALRLLIEKPDLLRTDLPTIAGILFFFLGLVADPGESLRIIFWVLAAASLFIVLIAIFLTRVSPGTPPAWYRGRFLHVTGDSHVQTLLTASTPKRLDDYVRQKYPAWYLPELIAELWKDRPK